MTNNRELAIMIQQTVYRVAVGESALSEIPQRQ